MAGYERLDIYKTLLDGMIPLFYNKNKEVAKEITEALYNGDSHILEFTNRGGALEVFSYLINIAPQVFPKMIIGAGTIIDDSTVALFIAQRATIGGPKFVEAILGPCPKTKIMPTGGVSVDEENIKAWFRAGVACIGMGSQLISKKLVADKDYRSIAENVAKVLRITRQ